MKTQLETRLKINDLFGSLQPEKEQELDKTPIVKPNKSLEYLIKEYERFMEKSIDYAESEELYKKLKFHDKHLTSKNIEEFSLTLGSYQKLENYFLGIYLSKLINNSKDKEFTIHTNYLDNLINFLGYKNNGKTITINGNAGNWLGESMIEGSITVKGNARDLVGSLMQNGTIKVNGYAGEYVGRFMENGTIYLNGNYESLSNTIYGGPIYHKGKLIVKNGRRLE